MTGVALTITVDDLKARETLAALLASSRDLSAFMADAGEEMLDRTRLRFQNEETPDGAKWAGLRPATIENRLRNGYNTAGILRQSGALFASINRRSTATSASVGTNMVYGAIHNFGGKAGRNHSVTIRARTYIGFGKGDLDALERVAQRHFGPR